MNMCMQVCIYIRTLYVFLNVLLHVYECIQIVQPQVFILYFGGRLYPPKAYILIQELNARPLRMISAA